MKHSQKISSFFILCIFSCALFVSSANAITLKEAKSTGAVGEQSNGYLGVVGHASPAIQSLVKKVNQQRQNKYQNIAATNKTSLKSIERLAGKKTMQKTPVGQFIKKSGRWFKK